MDYNSRFFEQRQIPAAGGGTTTTYDLLVWRKDTGIGGILSGTQTSIGGGLYNVTIYWIEWNGTKHVFQKNNVSSIHHQIIDSTESELLRLDTGDYFYDYTVSSESS